MAGKTNQLPYQEAGEAAYWGTQLEPIVKVEFTKRTGIAVNDLKQLLQSEQAENLLKQMLGNNEIGTVGSSVVAWKAVSQERLDTKTLKAESLFSRL